MRGVRLFLVIENDLGEDLGDLGVIVVVGADRAKTLVFPSGPTAATIGIDQYK